MNETKNAFRLVVKREIRRQGELFEREGQYFYHAVATNWLEEEKNTDESSGHDRTRNKAKEVVCAKTDEWPSLIGGFFPDTG